MNPDLERLIALQRLDSAAQDAERRLAEEPERHKAIDTRLDDKSQLVSAAKEHLTASQNARRALEKEVSVHQGRLSKFREQAMAVKTNQEYHAIQHEIAVGPSAPWAPCAAPTGEAVTSAPSPKRSGHRARSAA